MMIQGFIGRLAASVQAAVSAFRKAWYFHPSKVVTVSVLADLLSRRSQARITTLAELQDALPVGTQVLCQESVPPGQVWVHGRQANSPQQFRGLDWFTLGIHKDPGPDPAAVVTSVRRVP